MQTIVASLVFLQHTTSILHLHNVSISHIHD